MLPNDAFIYSAGMVGSERGWCKVARSERKRWNRGRPGELGQCAQGGGVERIRSNQTERLHVVGYRFSCFDHCFGYIAKFQRGSRCLHLGCRKSIIRVCLGTDRRAVFNQWELLPSGNA